MSDEEVIFKQVNSKLVYVRYKYEEGDGYLTVATVRPETIMGDVAVAVHPEDERYKHLHGMKVIVPLVNRAVPVVTDEKIDREFGTGCLKVTPAHDIVDYEIGLRHKLPVIDTLNEDGTIAEAGKVFVGLNRFVARKKAIQQLQEEGLMEKVEEYSHQVGHSERTDAVIEPKLSQQWFLKMKDISKPALDAVVNGEVNLIPNKFINTYKHWMENVHDWCLSRQLWWGQRIPAWYDDKGNYVVAKTKEEAVEKFKIQNSNFKIEDIKQDEDVLDTWFSSWLWPISVFDGMEKPEGEIKYYYPTNDLVTAPEILFFWVARMIISGCEYKKEVPFKNVYLTGIVRDKQGRKMSKSLGNSPDPIELIEKFSADGVRVGMLLCSPAGNDLPFDEAYCEQGRNFTNKIWNAFRLIKGWEVNDSIQPTTNKVAVNWFASRFNEQLEEINDLYSKYRISEVLMTSYKLVWDDFCAWYLEMIKPAPSNSPERGELPRVIDKATFEATIGFFENILKVLHPFMPFITEELWCLIKERTEKDCIILAVWPKAGNIDRSVLQMFPVVAETITNVRNIRKSKNISPKEKLSLYLKGEKNNKSDLFDEIIIKLANLDSFQLTDKKMENTTSFIVNQFEFFVPFSASIDLEAEKERIDKELEYNKGFLLSVQKKLANERFVSNAKPEVVDSERKKQADAEAKIKALEEQLNNLG